MNAITHRAQRAARATNWRTVLAGVPGVAVALLPKGTCPACLPLYASLFPSLGFLVDGPWSFVVMAGLLAVALATFAFRAPMRRGYGPFWLGLVAAALLLVGRFAFGLDAMTWVGLPLFFAASAWNAWPRRRRTAACAHCSPT